ncbi:MAG: AAA family ATPase [Solirubrobacteraceae bacterium]|nr:AAA family ATPase [Solirubrobacteraceae bacterium]
MPGPTHTLLDLDALPGLSIAETHGSRVYLSGDRAYKVRKAVRFPFLDQTAVADRDRLAHTEVRINADLAPSTYLGVITALVGGVPEPVVEMRRFAEASTLVSRLADGRVNAAMLEQLGQRLAVFHAAAPIRLGGGAAESLARIDRNAEELLADFRDALPARDLWRRTRPLQASVLLHADLLDDRAAAGHWREGHGDLRADHVVFDDDGGLQIVDRLEFDPSLRTHDVGDDLAFLLMDLEARGARWAAETVLAAYRTAGGDPGPPQLLATWSAYRACVSAKVALLRHRQAPQGRAADRAHELLQLAGRLAWRTRPARTYVMCGPPATGKSTIAAVLSERSGFPVVSSDVVRKRAEGVRLTERAAPAAYSAARTNAVYRDLGLAAAAALDAGADGVIVDATMGASAMRAVFLDALADSEQPIFVECRVPRAEADHRARMRLHDVAAISDATPAVAARLAAAWEPLDEIPAAHHLVVRADRPLAAVLDGVEQWLDTADGPG